MMESKFNALINAGQFNQAAALLKECLAAAELVNPRDDYSWGPASDVLGYRILAQQGTAACAVYWQDLLKFFQEQLEPAWGHLHKGHLFFRLGLAKFGEDAAEAQKYLEDALAEDRLWADTHAEQVYHLSPATFMPRFPSFILLVMLERIPADYFASAGERRRFYQGMAPLRFDVIWDQKEVEPSLVRHALGIIVPPPGLESALALREELRLASAQQLYVTTFTLVSHFLETILFHALYGARDMGGLNLWQADLGALLKEAIRRDIFPSAAIRSTCQLVHILKNEVFRPGEKTYRYELNAAIVGFMALGLKILLDAALVEWAGHISK